MRSRARLLRLVLAALLGALVLAGPAIARAADEEEAAGPYLAIRGVDARGGDVVRLTFLGNGAGFETLAVRVTEIEGEEFRGELVGRPASSGLSALRVGAVIPFTAGQIHSLAHGPAGVDGNGKRPRPARRE